MEAFIIDLVSSHPIVATILIAVGTLRAVFKPIVSVAQAYVDSTVDTSDNEKLKKIMESKLYKGFSWLLDYSASIKLPKGK